MTATDDATAAPAGKRARATALPPSERRAEIVAAALPLLVEHGAALTTRQIAEAAGVAEGTIFRVFEDKQALIDAALESATDPAPTEAALREIDLSLPLEERMVQAVEIIRRRVAAIFQLMAAIGSFPPEGRPPAKRTPSLHVLADVLAPDAHQLNRDPAAAAHVLRGLTLIGTHPLMIDAEPMSSAEIVALVLDGIRARPDVDAT